MAKKYVTDIGLLTFLINSAILPYCLKSEIIDPMKKLYFIFALFHTSYSWSASLELAAFSAVIICANHDGTNNQEVCYFSMYHEPNAKIELVDGEGSVLIDHSVPGLGFKDLKTFVSIKAFEKVIQIKASTYKDGDEFIGPVAVTTPSIPLLNTVQYWGPKVCGNPECNVYYKPFIYLGAPWSPEDLPQSH